MKWFNKNNKFYSIISVFIATFPIMRPQISAYFIGFWSIYSIYVFFINRNYSSFKRKDVQNIIGLSLIYIIYFLNYLLSEKNEIIIIYLGKCMPILLFPLFFILNKQNLDRSIIKKALIVFAYSNTLLATTILMILYSKGIYNLILSDNYYNPVIRNEFIEISQTHIPYLGIMFVFSVMILIKSIFDSFKKKLIIIVLNVLSIFILLFSLIIFSSRIALMSLFICLVFLFFKLLKPKYSINLVLITITLVSFLIISIPSSFRRFTEIKSTKLVPPYKGQTSDQANFRYGIYLCDYEILKENWIFGIGSENIQNELNECYKSYTYRNYDDYNNTTYNSHNQYIDFFIKYGIFGIFGFILFLFWGIRNNYILYKIFLLIFLISLLTENILDRQVGIVFFSYFNSLFFILKEDRIN